MTLGLKRFRSPIPTFLRLRQISKVIEQHPVNENVATTHFLQEDQLGTMVEKSDEVQRCIST